MPRSTRLCPSTCSQGHGCYSPWSSGPPFPKSMHRAATLRGIIPPFIHHGLYHRHSWPPSATPQPRFHPCSHTHRPLTRYDSCSLQLPVKQSQSPPSPLRRQAPVAHTQRLNKGTRMRPSPTKRNGTLYRRAPARSRRWVHQVCRRRRGASASICIQHLESFLETVLGSAAGPFPPFYVYPTVTTPRTSDPSSTASLPFCAVCLSPENTSFRPHLVPLLGCWQLTLST